jgi:hypothetical protein
MLSGGHDRYAQADWNGVEWGVSIDGHWSKVHQNGERKGEEGACPGRLPCILEKTVVEVALWAHTQRMTKHDRATASARWL